MEGMPEFVCNLSTAHLMSPCLQRKDSISAAVILTTFFDSPREALHVKPWRPPGAAGAVCMMQLAGDCSQLPLCVGGCSCLPGLAPFAADRWHPPFTIPLRWAGVPAAGKRVHRAQRHSKQQQAAQQAGQQQEQPQHAPAEQRQLSVGQEQVAGSLGAPGHEE